MADKATQIILEALGKAVAEPGGLPLFGSKKSPGLFTNSATVRPLAQRCKDEGYLRVLEGAASGKALCCAITEKGLAFLLNELSPRKVLEDLARVLESRQTQVGELAAAVQQWQSGLDALRATIERIAQRLEKGEAGVLPGPSANGSDIWLADLVGYLAEWRASGKSSDCPLPELYRRALQIDTHLSIGHFHDGLRRLHEQQRIYLHPWTGPMYDLPEPAYALMVGHELAYYGSIRP